MAHPMTQKMYDALSDLKTRPTSWRRLFHLTRIGLLKRGWAEQTGFGQEARVTPLGDVAMDEFRNIVRKPKAA